MKTILQLVQGVEFQSGVLTGVGGVGLIITFRRRKPDWGLIWGMAVIVGSWLARVVSLEGFWRSILTHLWVLPVAIAAAAAAVVGLYRIRDEPVAGPALALSILAIWASVPDTEQIAVQVGVMAVMLWVWWPVGWASVRLAGAIVIALLAVAAIVVGGVGRATSIVGGLGALAALGWSALVVPRHPPFLWLVLHGVLVFGWSRLAGQSPQLWRAPVIGIAISLFVAVMGYLITRESRLLAGQPRHQ